VERNATDAQRQYWRNYLADFRVPSVFPFKKTASGASVAKLHFELEPALTSQLVGFGKEKTVTLSTIAQVIWGILLGKYNESVDVVFGLVVSIRPPEILGIEHSLGMYVNTVPVRVNSFSEQSFQDLVILCQNKALQSWPHHHLSLHEIFKTTPLQSRLFDQLFIFQNYPMSATGTSVLEAKNIEISEHVNYGLVIEARPGETLRFTFEYDEATYDRRDLERLADQFLVLTRKLISRPDQRIADLSLLDAETEERLRESIAKEQSIFAQLGSFNFDGARIPADEC
jgi:non-ribosomal peptide synthetase component F